MSAALTVFLTNHTVWNQSVNNTQLFFMSNKKRMIKERIFYVHLPNEVGIKKQVN